MAKKTQKTQPAQEVAKPAVRRRKVVKPAGTSAPSSPVRRPAARRSTKAVAIADDRGLSAAVAAEVMAPVAMPEPTHAEIASRAYFIHLRRNGAPGSPDQDWLLAVSELRRERGLI